MIGFQRNKQAPLSQGKLDSKNSKRGWQSHSSNIPLNLMLTQAKFSNQYQGILVKIGGRLRGVQRAKRLQLSYGGISAQTARSFLLSNKTQIFTKWGTYGSTVFVSRSSP